LVELTWHDGHHPNVLATRKGGLSHQAITRFENVEWDFGVGKQNDTCEREEGKGFDPLRTQFCHEVGRTLRDLRAIANRTIAWWLA
jgi:hypothetical protein